MNYTGSKNSDNEVVNEGRNVLSVSFPLDPTSSSTYKLIFLYNVDYDFNISNICLNYI